MPEFIRNMSTGEIFAWVIIGCLLLVGLVFVIGDWMNAKIDSVFHQAHVNQVNDKKRCPVCLVTFSLSSPQEVLFHSDPKHTDDQGQWDW